MGDVDLSLAARVFEYTAAVDPIGAGVIAPVPLRQFSPEFGVGAGYSPFDLRAELGVDYLATTPALVAGFLRLANGAQGELPGGAVSRVLYVLEGSASLTAASGEPLPALERGDFLAGPALEPLVVTAGADGFWAYVVDDRALLSFLGAAPIAPRTPTAHYRAAMLDGALRDVAADPDAATRNRVSVLLGNDEITDTLTVTRTLWAMYGLLPVDAVQRPHRHQSVAVDLIIEAAPGCYTLVGDAVDETGAIVDPIRVDWASGGVFITPPGRWHSHHNESGRPARLLPIQDAGLQTYLRTLDIRFTR